MGDNNLENLKNSHNKFQPFIIQVQHKQNNQILDKEEILKDLSPSMYLLMVLGIFTVAPPAIDKKPPCWYYILKTVEYIIHSIWLYIVVVSTMAAVELTRTLQASFTLSFFNILLGTIRFTIYLNRHKLYPVLKSMEEYHYCVTSEKYKPIKNILLLLCSFCLLVAVIMFYVSMDHLRVAGVLENYLRTFLLGLSFGDDGSPFAWIPVILAWVTIFYHHYTPLAMCIFLCSIYLTFKRSIEMFGKKINEDKQRRQLNIDMYVALYNQTIKVLLEIENLLSACTFFIYGGLMTNQLCVVTQIVGGGGVLTHPVSVSMEVLVSLKNISVFLIVTLMSSAVSNEIGNVVSSLKSLNVGSTKDFQKLSLLLQGIGNCPPTFTAWKMFSLRKGLILTATSVMISYAMLLIQFTSQKKPHVSIG